jgi:hypothetical protein
MTGSIVRTAIADAARRLGHEDPVVAVDELTGVDVGALRSWRASAGAVRRSLSDGSERLGYALPVMAQGWSSPAPREAVRHHREAGLSARDVVDRHLAAVLDTVGTLESTRTSAQAELARTEDSVRAIGWPPGEDLITWASANGRLPAVMAAVGGLVDAVRRLRSRNDAALQALQSALQDDPAGPVEALPALAPAAFPGAATEPPVPPAPPIDRANLDRLAADLRSDDDAVRGAAQGVRSALDRAQADWPTAQLLIYESASSSSQGRAAISVGDITTADTVLTMAPGVSSSLVEMGDGVHDALTLAGRTAEIDPGGRTAVISWYGYETPLAVDGGTPMTPEASIENVAAAGNDVYARIGGQQLVDDLAGFRSLAPAGARFVGYGHSMGATVISAAAARGAGFDDVILAGSPGASVDVDSVADYPGMTPGHVWVNSLDLDPITNGITDTLADSLFGVAPLGRLMQPTPYGPDPAAAHFGANLLDVPSNAPDIQVHTGGPLGGLTDFLTNEVNALHLHHNGANYLAGASLDATAAIVVGRYEDVPIRPGR